MKNLLKIFQSVFLTVIMTLAVYTSSHAVPLDIFNDGVWSTLASEDKVREDGFLGPGGGGQEFDAEYLFYKLEGGVLSLGLQAGFDLIDGEITWGGHEYYAGDLALSFDADPLTYEYAVDFGLYTEGWDDGAVGGNTGTGGIDSAGVYAVSEWSNDILYGPSKPFAMKTGTLLGELSENSYDTGKNVQTYVSPYYLGGDDDDMSYYRIISFPTSFVVLGDFNLSAHWTQSCGNDAIDGKFPEPGTIFLLSSLATGLFGFSGLRRRFTK